MPRLSDTIGRLVGQRMADAMTTAHGEDRLSDLTDFGSNPGNLRARVYVPAQLQPRPALGKPSPVAPCWRSWTTAI